MTLIYICINCSITQAKSENSIRPTVEYGKLGNVFSFFCNV